MVMVMVLMSDILQRQLPRRCSMVLLRLRIAQNQTIWRKLGLPRPVSHTIQWREVLTVALVLVSQTGILVPSGGRGGGCSSCSVGLSISMRCGMGVFTRTIIATRPFQ